MLAPCSSSRRACVNLSSERLWMTDREGSEGVPASLDLLALYSAVSASSCWQNYTTHHSCRSRLAASTCASNEATFSLSSSTTTTFLSNARFSSRRTSRFAYLSLYLPSSAFNFAFVVSSERRYEA